MARHGAAAKGHGGALLRSGWREPARLIIQMQERRPPRGPPLPLLFCPHRTRRSWKRCGAPRPGGRKPATVASLIPRRLAACKGSAGRSGISPFDVAAGPRPEMAPFRARGEHKLCVLSHASADPLPVRILISPPAPSRSGAWSADDPLPQISPSAAHATAPTWWARRAGPCTRRSPRSRGPGRARACAARRSPGTPADPRRRGGRCEP